jgi:hypothetical protein
VSKRRLSVRVRKHGARVKCSSMDGFGLPKPVFRKCFCGGGKCVDPCSHFCGVYPYLVDPVDPDDIGEVWERERVIVPACARYVAFERELV